MIPRYLIPYHNKWLTSMAPRYVMLVWASTKFCEPQLDLRLGCGLLKYIWELISQLELESLLRRDWSIYITFRERKTIHTRNFTPYNISPINLLSVCFQPVGPTAYRIISLLYLIGFLSKHILLQWSPFKTRKNLTREIKY